MRKEILTHKILPIISVFILSLFILCTSCFAANNEFVVDYNYVTDSKATIIIDDSILSQYNYYCFCVYKANGSEAICEVFLSNEPLNFEFSDTVNETKLYGCFDFLRLYGSSSDLLFDFSNTHQSFTNQDFSSNGYSFNHSYDLVYSSYDIYDLSGNLVFQGAPQEVAKVELMKATQVEEIPQQILGVVKIMVPIFLAIFGVLLVLYLIKSKNLLHL